MNLMQTEGFLIHKNLANVKTAVAFQLLFIEVYNGCLNDLVLFAAVNGFKGLRQCC